MNRQQRRQAAALARGKTRGRDDQWPRSKSRKRLRTRYCKR
jgi:hypothetical protein